MACNEAILMKLVMKPFLVMACNENEFSFSQQPFETEYEALAQK